MAETDEQVAVQPATGSPAKSNARTAGGAAKVPSPSTALRLRPSPNGAAMQSTQCAIWCMLPPIRHPMDRRSE